MEGLGDGEGENGNRGLAAITVDGEGRVCRRHCCCRRGSLSQERCAGPLHRTTVSMLTPSARHGGHYRCTGCLSARLKTNFMPVKDEHNLIDCCTFRTIDRGYMQALREVRNGDYVVVNGSIRRRDSVMHIRVYSIRLVTNYNEITHHFLHCIYVSLDLQKQLREREMNIRRANLVVACRRDGPCRPRAPNHMYYSSAAGRKGEGAPHMPTHAGFARWRALA
uniref:OB domain-containing protein n=1 Tax=Triticum urartu TaxID=4572 RepID=A0A8R7QKQ0_TRIUA